MMEKGSFHTSRTSFTIENDERVKNIPLPNQLPKGMDFHELPVATLKSSTLETLIGQNEDLMARLAVSLRKISSLEEKIVLTEQETQALRGRFETLKEQHMVTLEKDRAVNQRTSQLLQENADHKTKLTKLEKLYAEVFVQAQSFQRRMTQLERYRVRVKKVGPGIRTQLIENKYLREHLKTTQLQNEKTIQNYETKLLEAREQVDALRDKANERDRLLEDNMRLQNALIFETRQFEAKYQDAVTRMTRAEQEAVDLRIEIKELLVEREAKFQDLETLQREVPNLQADRQRLIEQVESLQALWSHKQKEIEQLEEKNKSLQKLNQTISLTMNQQRKEIQELNTKLEHERYLSIEKTRALLQEIDLLRNQAKLNRKEETR